MPTQPKVIETEQEPEPIIVQESRRTLPGARDMMYSRLGQMAAPKLGWYHCREQFHNSVQQIPNGFFFAPHSIHNVGMLLDWAERTLNIKPKMRSKLYRCGDDDPTPCFPTTRKTNGSHAITVDETVYVELSPFWRKDYARFFFSTIICKASIKDAIFHPLDAILDTIYCRSTRLATARFLDGYTLRGGDIKDTNATNINWVWQFHADANAKKLVKPETKDETIFFINRDPTSKLSADEREKIQAWLRELPAFSKFEY